MFTRRTLMVVALGIVLAAALGLPYLTPAKASVDGIQVLVNDCSSLTFRVNYTRETEGLEDSCAGYYIGGVQPQGFGDGYCQLLPGQWNPALTFEFDFPMSVPEGTPIVIQVDHCWGGILEGPVLAALQQEPWCDFEEITVMCGGSGCDAQLNIPETAVVGQFVADALTYWAPQWGAALEPNVVLQAGKTAWVLGVDASGDFYKIIWQCDYLWVPVGTMGPNPDAVWNSTPLPTVVVQ